MPHYLGTYAFVLDPFGFWYCAAIRQKQPEPTSVRECDLLVSGGAD